MSIRTYVIFFLGGYRGRHDLGANPKSVSFCPRGAIRSRVFKTFRFLPLSFLTGFEFYYCSAPCMIRTNYREALLLLQSFRLLLFFALPLQQLPNFLPFYPLRNRLFESRLYIGAEYSSILTL